MNQNEFYDYQDIGSYAAPGISLSSCLSRVYRWMALALAVSGATAYYVGNTPAVLNYIGANPSSLMILLVLELLLVMWISAGINKLSFSSAFVLFLVYAAFNGISLGLIFLAYTKETLTSTFLITAGTFGAAALFGNSTKRDLSVMGHAMRIGLWGLIIATVVNIFMHNSEIYWITTYAGVLIFTGLAAYDAWKMKQIFASYDTSNEDAVNRIAIIGALELYLDFINLFLYLLRARDKR